MEVYYFYWHKIRSDFGRPVNRKDKSKWMKKWTTILSNRDYDKSIFYEWMKEQTDDFTVIDKTFQFNSPVIEVELIRLHSRNLIKHQLHYEEWIEVFCDLHKKDVKCVTEYIRLNNLNNTMIDMMIWALLN
jgi:hypothetical protein|tara:strand:- start:137 stop:529 length:393 start_codon:yes stop_codon:yes gene_type:complete